MSFPRHNHFIRRERDRNRDRERYPERSERPPKDTASLIHPGHTGSESDYLKSLVDSHAMVTVVLKTGEKLHGFIRYYDKHCFSLGLSDQGPRLFLRKASVSYISEE
jgi:hypothetical protein